MSNIANVKIGIKGRSVPAGGDAGQILQKATDNDFDMIWTTPAGGASANIPQPAGTIPVKDSDGGAVGSGVSFARSDHSHELNVSNTLTDVKPNGQRSLGISSAYARVDHVHQRDTYPLGFAPDGDIKLKNNIHIFDSVEDLPTTHVAGRIVFVKVS